VPEGTLGEAEGTFSIKLDNPFFGVTQTTSSDSTLITRYFINIAHEKVPTGLISNYFEAFSKYESTSSKSK
jgi:hypothetical protein